MFRVVADPSNHLIGATTAALRLTAEPPQPGGDRRGVGGRRRRGGRGGAERSGAGRLAVGVDTFERAGFPPGAGGEALQLPAGCFRQGHRFEQSNGEDGKFEVFEHSTPDGGDHRRAVERAQIGAPDLGSNPDLLDPINKERKSRARTRLERRMARLGHTLDILRVVILPSHDNDVLDAASHVELVILQKAQVACAQPRSGAISLTRVHAFDSALRLAPVTRRDVGAAQPNFPYHGSRTGLTCNRIHDGEFLASHRMSATHNQKGIGTTSDDFHGFVPTQGGRIQP